MSAVDLELKNVSKRYRIRHAEPSARKGRFWDGLGRSRLRTDDFWAVRDVTFNVDQGEAVGIIGHNGAGKSTLLKLLSSISTPTSGEIIIRGRLSALIEVGSGFHPELTGRENVYLSGSILGMRRREINAKLESIVAFAELTDFIDTPVKRYSSGMYVRLGFSIAAHLDPDILLLDEVLAVGDAAFQSKCLNRIIELKRSGKSIVFISHDLQAVERLCNRALLMDHGRLISQGNTRRVIAEYQNATAKFSASAQPLGDDGRSQSPVQTTNLAFYDSAGARALSLRSGEPVRIRLDYVAHEPVRDVVFEVVFYSQDERLRCVLSTQSTGEALHLQTGKGAIDFDIPDMGLLAGVYLVDLTIGRRGAPIGKHLDWQVHCATVCVERGKEQRGDFYMPHRWKLVSTISESCQSPLTL